MAPLEPSGEGFPRDFAAFPPFSQPSLPEEQRHRAKGRERCSLPLQPDESGLRHLSDRVAIREGPDGDHLDNRDARNRLLKVGYDFFSQTLLIIDVACCEVF
jgi:hypothetical protein